jgi:hypothetical protein
VGNLQPIPPQDCDGYVCLRVSWRTWAQLSGRSGVFPASNSSNAVSSCVVCFFMRSPIMAENAAYTSQETLLSALASDFVVGQRACQVNHPSQNHWLSSLLNEICLRKLAWSGILFGSSLPQLTTRMSSPEQLTQLLMDWSNEIQPIRAASASHNKELRRMAKCYMGYQNPAR